MKSRGFTLIELLVVIAIIGTLTAVVLTSIYKAKDRSADMKTRAQLTELRGVAEAYYSSNGFSFSTASNCTSGMFADPDSKMTDYTNLSNYPVGTTLACQSNNIGYVVQASLTSGGYWCVDNLVSKFESLPLDGSAYNCL